ncbi:sugar phosphate isomerase/epimerase family protein [Planctellipticum variicoloris]|uniref:sugar phosphate isomerase/epimerase family protein n=1 Tax=Planctellipticum variicoloris TaxID=3064265 RepID=UPI002BA4DC14|nr:sugar phosphate isomerase/epimerase [Planctomycetaceae bacterium SH412]HTN00328.1 sugar phosphate isomerase/epimerase family protein [Planctomycetaceae bacterium]
MHPFRLSVATRCLQQPLRQSFQTVAGMGAQGIVLDVRQEVDASLLTETARRDLLHFVRELGLSVAGAVIPTRQPLNVEHELDRRILAIKGAMTAAWQLQARVLCFRAGTIPAEEDSPEYKLLLQVLQDLAAHANHVGVALALTPVNDSAESLRRLINQVQTGPLGIDFDPAQFAMTGRSVNESLRALHDLVWHVQLRDGLKDFAGGGDEVPVGQGVVDWIEVLALLSEADYRGWLTAVRTQGNDRAADLTRAIQHVGRVLLGG